MKPRIVPILILVCTASLFAQQPVEETVARRGRIAKQSSTITGDRGLFTIPSVETLNRGQFSFGGAWSNSDRTPLDLDINSFPVYVSYGLFGRLTVTGTWDVRKQVTARNLSQPGFHNALPFVTERFSESYGDTLLSVKYRLQRRRDNVGGIAIKGTFKFPTSKAEKGVGGSGKTDVGLELIFSSLLPWGFTLHSNMGLFSTTDAIKPSPLGFKDELRSGFGTAWPAGGIGFVGGRLQGIAEYSSVTFVGAGTPNAVIQSPTDITYGLRYLMLDWGITIDAGYRNNRNFDKDFPGNTNNHGWVVSATYTKPVAQVGSNRFPLVVLEIQQEEIPVGGSATITATGFDADNDRLSYSWLASGGKIVGSGEQVTFDATGVAPGKYTVRAVTTDGRGGRSQSEIEVTVRP